MKCIKFIKPATLLLIALAMAVLAACGNTSSGPEPSGQDNTAAEHTPTPAPPASPAPTPAPTPTPPPELDIPDYITIWGTQFSTELTALSLMRWDLRDYDITPLRYMINLTSLDLNHTAVSDLSPIAGLINLTELRLLDNTITDLTPLAGLTNLTALQISLRDFDNTDITPLKNLTGLTYFHLSLGGNMTEDISRLAYLPNLTRLDLWHNQISDISPLEGLTNLTHLDLAGGDNPVSDISPLANLTKLNTFSIRYRPGVDMALLYNIPPRVAPPVADTAPGNPHPFAQALTGFFTNLTTPGEWWMQHNSYHAVLVDVDGQGTPGVVASRWAFDGDRNHPFSFSNFIHIHPSFSQKLIFVYDGQLHEVYGHWGVTPAGRVVALAFDGACDIAMTTYTLLDITDGHVVGTKALIVWDMSWGDNYYSVNYHVNEHLVEDFNHRQSLTRAEFEELMDMYGLHGTSVHLWELPNDTYNILSMPAG